MSLDTGVPCSFGVLTVENMDQALARAGGGKRHQGEDAAHAVLRWRSCARRCRERARVLEPAGAVNLLSDTQTRPTRRRCARRWRTPSSATSRRAGPDRRSRSQERVAELLGHEAALFLPSGTMCNQIAIRLHCARAGDEIILDRMAHPIVAEAGGPAVHAGRDDQPDRRPTAAIFGPPSSRRALRPAGDRYRRARGSCRVEQTTNLRGGRVWPLETIDAVIKAAHMHGCARTWTARG